MSRRWLATAVWITASSALAGNDLCEVPFGLHWSLAEVESSLRSSHEGVRSEIYYKERFPGQFPENVLESAIAHAEWLVKYYETFNLSFRNGTDEAIGRNLAWLQEHMDRSSVEEGWKLLEIQRYFDEFSGLSMVLSPDVYNQIIGNILSAVEEWKQDPTKNKSHVRQNELRLAIYRMHFGREFFKPSEVEHGYSTILELRNDGLGLPEPFVDYLTGLATMTRGQAEGSKVELLGSVDALQSALNTYGIGCNQRLAAKIYYLLMGTHSELAQSASARDETLDQIGLALRAGVHARAYAGLLEDPKLWSAVHKRSSDVFALAAAHEVGEHQREEFEQLSRRAYDLAIQY